MSDFKENSNNYFNTWDYVSKIRKAITLHQNPILERLSRSWKVLQQGIDKTPLECDENIIDNPLEALCFYIDHGRYPPPEVLVPVRECLKRYQQAGGLLELEDVFYLKRKRNVGNHAAQVASDALYEHFYLTEYLEGRSYRRSIKKSQVHRIEEYLADWQLFDMDVDNFKRGYNRWKARTGKATAD